MTRPAAICLHVDSLAEAAGFPAGFEDPTFALVTRRFLPLADRYGFRSSIYVVGRDLESAGNRRHVRAWAAAGHEIGNHSWAHARDLGALAEAAIRADVARAHAAIAAAAGRAPAGFVAPAWSTSRRLRRVLGSLGYRYDASSVPSWVMFPALAKVILNARRHPRFRELAAAAVRRRDYLDFVTGRRGLHRAEGGLAVVPVPTNRWRLACWHTLVFVLGWPRHARLLRSCLAAVEGFHYVLHPADLLGDGDVDGSRPSILERLGGAVELKRRYAEQAIELILASGREVVTMDALVSRAAPAAPPRAGAGLGVPVGAWPSRRGAA